MLYELYFYLKKSHLLKKVNLVIFKFNRVQGRVDTCKTMLRFVHINKIKNYEN